MSVGALEKNMPLLCGLGWHRPARAARWNRGYYFTKCARCGQDMVRTAYGRWHVPRGYRVLWQAQPPANAVSAALVHDRAASVPAGAELPIQAVLRHLQNDDRAPPAPPPTDDPGPADEAPQAESPPDSAPAQVAELISRAVPAARIPDFMDDKADLDSWEPPTRAHPQRPAPPDPIVERDGGEDGPYFRLKTRVTGLFERDGSEAPPARAPQTMRLALILLVPLMLMLFALLFWGGRDYGRPGGADANAAQNAKIGAGSGRPAFVTASVLNCRTSPAREAESVKVLMRGDLVLLLAGDAEWVSLVHEGGQCWALARYFSAEQPI